MNSNGQVPQHLRNDLLPQEEFLDLKKYVRLLWLHKTVIFITAGLFAAIAATALKLDPNRFEATATLSFESDRANLTEIREVVEEAPENQDYLQTQVEIIKSRQLVNRAIQRLNLTTESLAAPDDFFSDIFAADSRSPVPDTVLESTLQVESVHTVRESHQVLNSTDIGTEFSSLEASIIKERPISGDNTSGLSGNTIEVIPIATSLAPASTVDPVLTNRVMKDLRVELVRGTQLIRISFKSYSAELSSRLPNALAVEYIASLSENRQAVATKAADWLKERLDTLRVNLEGSERALNEFQKANNLVDIDGVRGLASQELNDVTAQLLTAKRTLQQATTDYTLAMRKQGNVESLLVLPQVQNHPSIQGIRQQQANINRQISDLQLRYGPKHPKMIAANNELLILNDRLIKEIDEVAQVIVGEYEAAKERVAGLEAELDRVKSEFQAISQQETDNDELKRQVEINRELYNTFLTRAREASQGTGFETANARLSDPAIPPTKSIDNKASIIITGACFLGLLIACCAVLLYELLQDNIRNPDDVELQLNQKMFGLIPIVTDSSKSKSISPRLYFDNGQYQFSEAIKTLRTSLILSHLDAPAKIVAVTSSVPGEGKSTVSTSLAFALAQNERVLLIDADLRRPSVGKTFGLTVSRPGLTNLIAGSHTQKDCTVFDKESGLHVIPSGPVPPDAQQILNSLRFSNTVKLLSKHYDRIIIDTAPVNAVSDALMISRLSDSTLYVVKSGSTRKKIIQRGIGRLNQVGISIDGIILNQVDILSKSARSEEFYGYYGGQYGYGQETNSIDNIVEKRQKDVLEIA